MFASILLVDLELTLNDSLKFFNLQPEYFALAVSDSKIAAFVVFSISEAVPRNKDDAVFQIIGETVLSINVVTIETSNFVKSSSDNTQLLFKLIDGF